MNKQRNKTMKNVIAIALIAFGIASNAQASVRVFDQSDTNLGNYTDLKCSTGINCTQVSGKAQLTLGTVNLVGDAVHSLYGFLANRISTSGSRQLTFAECGSSISNDATVIYTLPSISGDATQKGCRFVFMVGTGVTGLTYVRVTPKAGEQILLLTNKQGDSISNDATGSSVTLESVSNLYWAPINKEQGTWVDVN